jgi:hypothetical protein
MAAAENRLIAPAIPRNDREGPLHVSAPPLAPAPHPDARGPPPPPPLGPTGPGQAPFPPASREAVTTTMGHRRSPGQLTVTVSSSTPAPPPLPLHLIAPALPPQPPPPSAPPSAALSGPGLHPYDPSLDSAIKALLDQQADIQAKLAALIPQKYGPNIKTELDMLRHKLRVLRACAEDQGERETSFSLTFRN